MINGVFHLTFKNNYKRMKTAFCPVSFQRIDEHVARLVASLVVISLIAFISTGFKLIIVFLLFDFLLRAFELSRYSLLAIISRKIIKAIRIQPKIINAGPKIFAARIGVVFSLLILVTSLSGWNTAAFIIALMFGTFAFLEAAFRFCAACEIYPYVYRFFYQTGSELK